MSKPFQTITQKIAWECPWYAVRQDEIVLPNGERGVYNVIVKSQAVWILPVTPAGEIVLVRQFRYTVDDWCWELPAGGVKPGQSLEEAAREELHEEIGGLTNQLEYLGQFYTANGICNEVGHYFLASDVALGTPAHEAAELMEIHPIPIPQVYHMARTGQLADAPSLLVLLLCEPRLHGRQFSDAYQ